MEEFGRQVSRGRPGPPPELAAAKINGRLSLELTRFVSVAPSPFLGFASLIQYLVRCSDFSREFESR